MSNDQTCYVVFHETVGFEYWNEQYVCVHSLPSQVDIAKGLVYLVTDEKEVLNPKQIIYVAPPIQRRERHVRVEVKWRRDWFFIFPYKTMTMQVIDDE